MSNRSKYDGRVITDIEKSIEDGQVFEAASLLSVANVGAKAKWLFRTGNKTVIIKERRITSNGDELTYQAFKEPTLSADGTPVSLTKRNGNSSVDPTVTIFETPTSSVDGAAIPPLYLPGTTGQGNSSSGQFDRDGFVRILEKNTTYMTQVTNNGAKNPANVEFYIIWAEIDDHTPRQE